MLFDNFVLVLINLIHLLVILFVVLVPFTNSTPLILLHSIIVPFIMFHWLVNNDTCAITEAERYIRIRINNGNPIQYNDCLSYKLVGPVYNFISKNPDNSKLTWGITISLWLISLYKLNYNRENLQKIFNL